MSITAMKQALNALEECRRDPRLKYEHSVYDKIITALRTAIAEAEKQEPVAWMHRHIDGNVITHKPADLNRHPDRWTPLYKNPTPCETCQALARTVMMDQTAHDTPPAAPVQVSPTDFVDMVMDKEDAIGKPIFWAEWPNRENT